MKCRIKLVSFDSAKEWKIVLMTIALYKIEDHTHTHTLQHMYTNGLLYSQSKSERAHTHTHISEFQALYVWRKNLLVQTIASNVCLTTITFFGPEQNHKKRSERTN